MVLHWNGLIKATTRLATVILDGLTLSITVGNKGNKSDLEGSIFFLRDIKIFS